MLKRSVWNKTRFIITKLADGKLLYGTTIRKIMEQPGFVKELNEEMLQLYLSLTYVAGENTFFRGLKKLLSGPVSCMAERKAYDRALLDASVSSGQ